MVLMTEQPVSHTQRKLRRCQQYFRGTGKLDITCSCRDKAGIPLLKVMVITGRLDTALSGNDQKVAEGIAINCYFSRGSRITQYQPVNAEISALSAVTHLAALFYPLSSSPQSI